MAVLYHGGLKALSGGYGGPSATIRCDGHHLADAAPSFLRFEGAGICLARHAAELHCFAERRGEQ